jgi:aryl sulfotransferase
VLAQLEAQTHRRLIKTHLPVSALVFSPKAKYIYVGRDVRDVVWSLYNHVANFTEQALERFNAPPDLGPPVERPHGDERQFYLDLLEGPDPGGVLALFGSSFWEHVQGWWDIRGLPNVLLVHFANLKADLPGEIRRIARHLEIPLDEVLMPRIIEHCGFDYMQQAAARMEALNMQFKDGARTFFNKGTDGRWKDVLTVEEVAKADEIAARNLTPDCAHWLKTGELPLS